MSEGAQISISEEITILLSEYSTLRDELLQRNSILNNTFAVAAALGAAVIGLAPTSLWEVSLLLLIASPVPLVFFASMIRFDTYKAAARVRDRSGD